MGNHRENVTGNRRSKTYLMNSGTSAKAFHSGTAHVEILLERGDNIGLPQ
jgi:hypothetical protein